MHTICFDQHWLCWQSNNPLDLYLGDVLFESQPGQGYSVRSFVVSLSPSMQLGHDHLLPDLLCFIINLFDAIQPSYWQCHQITHKKMCCIQINGEKEIDSELTCAYIW